MRVADRPTGAGLFKKGALMIPYRQGELDNFCALYSIVHAVSIAVRRHRGRARSGGNSPTVIPLQCFDKLRAELLLYSLARRLEAEAMLSAVLAKGTPTRLMPRLLAQASLHLRASYDTELVWSKPFHRQKAAHPRAISDAIREHMAQPHSGAIVKVAWGYDHWVAIASARATGFALAESDVDRQAWISTRRRVNLKRALHISRVVPTGLFLIRLVVRQR